MKDNYGRDINYMRISITDRCNLRCKYCMAEEGCYSKCEHENVLTFEQIERIVKSAAELGINKFRLTGGEPLVRKDIVELVRRLSAIQGVDELVMTTNGILLAEMAQELKSAGLDRVNISLDTTDPEKFKEITRIGDVRKVLDGIKAAEEAGLTPVKINTVVLGGFNDDELVQMAELTKEKPVDVRFIELMPIGHNGLGQEYSFVSNDDVKLKMPDLKPVESEDRYTVSDNYEFPEGKGRVGFISALSHHFCADCNRVRLTSEGKIMPCLHSNEEIDIKEALNQNDDSVLKETIRKAILRKPACHHLNDGAAPIERDMNRIGG